MTKFFSIDAERDDPSFGPGKFLNHSKNRARINVKPVLHEETKIVYFTPVREIFPGEELFYDYNDNSRESLTHNPWLAGDFVHWIYFFEIGRYG